MALSLSSAPKVPFCFLLLDADPFLITLVDVVRLLVIVTDS